MRITVSLSVELPASADVNQTEELIVEAGRLAMIRAVGMACREYEEAAMRCPHCGGIELRSEGTDQRVLLTSFGRVVLHLRRQRCQACGRRFRPAAALLECVGSGNVTGKLRSACVLAGASWPYKTAARVLGELCGAKVSPEKLRQLTALSGHSEAESQVVAARQAHSPTVESVRAKAAQPVVAAPHMLWVGLDGGWVASRDQPKGMEGKVGVVATRTEPVGVLGRQRLAERRLVATFGSSRLLGELACAAAIELGGHDAAQRVVLGDAANWIKTESQQHFASATKILDWPHLWRVVAKGVRAARPGNRHKAERKQLYEQLRELLWRGRVDEAIVVLVGLRDSDEVGGLEEAIQYLHNQRDWIGDYEVWQAQGYPVGSGLVERQVELVINRRLNGCGMRWLRYNANALVALRVEQLNQDWDHYTNDLAA